MHTKGQGKKGRQVAIRLNGEVAEMLDILSERWGLPASEVVRRSIRAAFRAEAIAGAAGTVLKRRKRK